MADGIPGPRSDCARLAQTSDNSSLEDSADETGKDLSPLPLPLKRKRSSFEEESVNGRDTLLEPSPKVMKVFEEDSAEALVKLDIEVSPDMSAVDRGLKIMNDADAAVAPSNEEQPAETQALPKQKRKKGKRKGKRTPNDEAANAENVGSGAESTAEHGGNAEAIYSNEEDAQIENMAEGAKAEDPIKMEERKHIHPFQWRF